MPPVSTIRRWAGTSANWCCPSASSGAFAGMLIEALGLGYPKTFMGLRLLIGGARRDYTASGSLTPVFVWDQGNLANTVHVGYSPFLDGGEWDGQSQTFAGQFENQINGTAFEAAEYLDPYYQENGIHIVHGNFRRSAPQVFNPGCVFAITSI